MVLGWLLVFALAYALVVRFVPGFGTPRIEVSHDGALVLHANRSGNYEVPGTINAVPVMFILDTGASTVSISDAMAQRMGISGCMPTVSSTANGAIPNCTAVAHTLTFGNFAVHDVQVGVLPQLGQHALLGMNVLSQMDLSQRDGVMMVMARSR